MGQAHNAGATELIADDERQAREFRRLIARERRAMRTTPLTRTPHARASERSAPTTRRSSSTTRGGDSGDDGGEPGEPPPAPSAPGLSHRRAERRGAERLAAAAAPAGRARRRAPAMSGTAERRDECQRQRDVVHATHDGRQLCAECYSGIADLLPDADWTPSTNGSSPNGKVTRRVEAIRHALLEDAIDTRDARGPARAPVFGTGDLLHRGIATLLFGARGEGKSIAALMLAMGAAATGERVLLLDRENGPMLTRSIIASVLAAHPEWT